MVAPGSPSLHGRWENMSPMHPPPNGAAFDIVLLAHVACVVVGVVTSMTAAATGARMRRLAASGLPLPEPLRRYFRPGVNWAGRTVYGIPVFGAALIAMSQGAYALADGWILAGLALFAVLVLVAEGVVWPAERRLQDLVAAAGGETAGNESSPSDLGERTAHDATVMARGATVAVLLLLAGTVLMIAQP